jgi:hypothetical protein
VSLNNRLTRLKKLERARVSPDRCPDCPALRFVEVDEAGNLLPGSSWPEPCRSCGGPHDDGIEFIEVVLDRREAGEEGGSE